MHYIIVVLLNHSARCITLTDVPINHSHCEDGRNVVCAVFTRHRSLFLIQKSGVEMHTYEAIELIDHLERNASDLGESNSVNYK